MHTVTLRPFFHRGQAHLAIVAPRHKELNVAIRKLKGVRWNPTHTLWHVPLTQENFDLARAALAPLARFEIKALKEYLAKQKEVPATRPDAQAAKTRKRVASKPRVRTKAGKLNEENTAALNWFLEQLTLKAYSPSTIKTYRTEFLQLLRHLKKKDVNALTPAYLRQYFVHCLEKLKLSENTLQSRINATKFYFEQVLGREKFLGEIPRPKKPRLLPKLLNEDEIGRLFRAVRNRKHKALLFTAYSAGLRVREIVNLKISDLDSRRMHILVQQANGKKDRYVKVSPVLRDVLQNYLKMEKTRPEVFLFESEHTRTAYPTQTLKKIFSEAKASAGIQKSVGIHSLRHSFATHLLEKGTEIPYIKELLGHFDIKTTERYLKVSKKRLVNILSPFDKL